MSAVSAPGLDFSTVIHLCYTVCVNSDLLLGSAKTAESVCSALHSPQGQSVKCSDEIVPVLLPIIQGQRANRNVWLHCDKTDTHTL